MSRVDDLVASYQRFVKLPWPSGLAYSQRVWMVVYDPDEERRLRLHVPAFANATTAAGHAWNLIDITNSFEEWLANHEYRDEYFAEPHLMTEELAGFRDVLVAQVRTQLDALSTDNTVTGLLGGGSLFGLGDYVKASTLIERVEDLVAGRLLMFFPGSVEDNNYRLLNGRDGWNYHASVITADKGSIL